MAQDVAAPASRPSTFADRLSALSTAIAIFVGGLYTVGAVLTTGQLRRAHLVVRDTLPLVPLSQMLGRGMSVFLKPFAGVLGIAIVSLAAFALGGWLERRLGRSTLRLGAATLAIALLALLSPPDVAIGTACCAVFLFPWVIDRMELRPALLLFAAAAAVMLLALSFYRPVQLADVTIATDRGPVRGTLITSASGTWYLGTGNRKFVAVLPEHIVSVRIDSGPHSPSPLFRRVLNVLGW